MVNTGVKSTASGSPVNHAEVMLQSATGTINAYVLTNANGTFSFNNLAYGTYKIYTEMFSLATNPAMVSLSATNPSVTGVIVVVSSSGITTGINVTNITAVTGELQVYPNPVSDRLMLNIPSVKTGNVSLIVNDICGNTILVQSQKLSTGMSSVELNVESLKPGTYMLKIIAADGSMMNKKISVVR